MPEADNKLPCLAVSGEPSIFKPTMNKIEAAIVTTANPLDGQLKAQVIDFIKHHGQQDVELTEIVD